MRSLTCTKCKETKPEELFARDKRSPSGRFCWCKDCKNEYFRQWSARNPGKSVASARKWQKANPDRVRRQAFILKLKRYGLTVEKYDEMVKNQRGACAICQLARVLVIDHDHVTGIVRGLLCHKCNKAIGLFDEDSARMVRATIYLGPQKGVGRCAS